MKSMKTLRSQSGFSLIELMVVVAIIGILATMSVGAVQKQIAKSRQSEVKTNLSSLFTAAKSFQAEWGQYSTRFGPIGAQFEGNLRYNVSFIGDIAPPATGYTGTVVGVFNDTAGYCPGAVAAGGANGACLIIPTNGVTPAAPNVTGVTGGIVTSSATEFVAAGTARIYQNGSGTNDNWAINSNKSVQNNVPGIF